MISGSRQITAPRVIACEEGIIVGAVGGICVVIWRGAVDAPRFALQSNGLAEVVFQSEHNAGFFCIVEPTATPPNDQLRKASAEMIDLHKNALKCVALVMEGTGFKAAVSRAVLSGMSQMLSWRRAPIGFFAHLPSAAQWANRHISLGDLDQFVLSCEALRSYLDSATGSIRAHATNARR